MKPLTDLEKAQVANAFKKVKAGKSLTSRESALVERYEASKTQTANPYDIDNTGMASFFDVTAKTICTWVKEGMPKESYGLYNLKKCFDWWCENIERTKEDNDPKITELRAENLRIKNDRERMKRDTEREMLFPKAEIADEWVKRVVEIRQGLLTLPVKLPPLLEGKPADEMRPVIKTAVYRLLEAYSRGGKFTPAKKTKAKKK